MKRRTLASKFLFYAFVLCAIFPNYANAGHRTINPNAPNLIGTWATLPYLMPIDPIAATLLHNGKILIVAGSEWDSLDSSDGSESYRVALWDPAGTSQSSFSVKTIDYDVFCSGVAVLPDGRPLIVGGTTEYTDWGGESRATIYDPATDWFGLTPNMVYGRWYATATTLGDGRVMAFSGSQSPGTVTNNTVEIFDLRNLGFGWTPPVAAPFTPPLYPREFLLPNGNIFFNGQGTNVAGNTSNSWIMNPANSTWTKSANVTIDRLNGSAVILPLLPPAYKPVVMNFGGGNNSTATTETIDLSAASPVWTAGPNMSARRIKLNSVLLPNGKVLIEGGSIYDEDAATANTRADIYNPVNNTMSAAGTASYARLYHSNALLLPDATVVSMGSNPSQGNYQPALERYTPPYLYDANNNLITTARPAITSTSIGPIGYGKTFSVNYTSNLAISSAVLIRLGSATHGFDMEQRLIGLCGPYPQPACNGNGTSLTLKSPPDGNIAPPGYYMLFILNSSGVPSIAKFIQLTPYTTTPPKGTIVSPTGKVTIPLGGTVNFSGSSTSSTDSFSWVFPGGAPGYANVQNPSTVTFNTSGTFGTTLTTVDASGNSDPSPPWRTITVLPTTTDFDIAVTPDVIAAPGQSAQFTVTVKPLFGFSDTVALSVDATYPKGVTSGGFSPATIPVGGTTSTLTINTSTIATPYATTLTITGVSGSGLTHTAAATLLIH